MLIHHPQTADDIKNKKRAKKEKKAAKAAAKAAGTPLKTKGKRGGAVTPQPEAAPVPAPAPQAEAAPAPPAADVDSAPQPTGSEAAPSSGTLSQRPPRATVEEAEEDE